MKKSLFIVFSLLLLLLTFQVIVVINSNSQPSKEIAKAMQESINNEENAPEIRIKENFSTDIILSEAADIDRFLKWMRGLKLKLVEFEKGSSPGDFDGGRVLRISAGNVQFSFRYAYYILYDDNWYEVENLNEPPYWDTIRAPS